MKEINCKLIIDFVKGHYENIGYTVIDCKNKSGQKALNVNLSKNELYVFTGYHDRIIRFDFLEKLITILNIENNDAVTYTISEYMTTICELMM